MSEIDEAQQLLSHAVPKDDLAALLDRALDALLAQEKRRFRAGKSRKRRLPRAGSRHVPLELTREVTERGGGQCTYADHHAARKVSALCKLGFRESEARKALAAPKRTSRATKVKELLVEALAVLAIRSSETAYRTDHDRSPHVPLVVHTRVGRVISRSVIEPEIGRARAS